MVKHVMVLSLSGAIHQTAYARGVNTWKPASKEGELYSSWDEVSEKHI